MIKDKQSLEHQAIGFERPIKVICIGSGYSGILAGVRLPQRIRNLELTIYEKNPDLGGTWLENKYPGVGCDVPSHGYQYTFAGNPNWTKFYSPGREIYEYLKDVAWRYDVEKYIRFQHFFQGADWDDNTQQWTIRIKDLKTNSTFTDTADIFIKATGLLNKWKWPNIEGLHSFNGPVMHTADFDENFDYSDKNIALIGGGSTGIQVLPTIQPKAKRVVHFMKGKTWISPLGQAADFSGGKNFEYTPEQRREFTESSTKLHQYRHALEEAMNKIQLVSFRGTKVQEEFWKLADDFMKEKLKRRPDIYKTLRPSFPPGCRRLTPGPGYLEALQEDNVEFIGTGITKATETGLLDMNGKFHEVDAIICATGFDYTFLTKDTPVTGRNGVTLDQMYAPDPQAYMGVTVPNMPNYFMFLGPASAPASGSFIPSLETIMEYIIKCIRKLQKEGYGSMDPKVEALQDFNAQADKYFAKTVFTAKCNSFFKGPNDEGRINMLWPGSATHYMEALRDPRWEDYRFELRQGSHGNRFAWLGRGLTKAQVDGGVTTAYLDEIDIPPVINKGPRSSKEAISHLELPKVNGESHHDQRTLASAASNLSI